MTADEARALFDAELDGELAEDDSVAFAAALASDAALQADYERHRSMLQATSALAQEGPRIDLLAGVQHKLRARSGGKFYRDRFSERRGSGRQDSMRVLLVLSACLVVFVLLWFAYDAGLLTIAR